MSIEIKYYKITDPQSGKVSKDVGVIYTREVRDYKAAIVDGQRQVLKNEVFTKTTERIPNVDGLVEISKAEFDALDIKGENEATKRYREHLLRRAASLEEQEALKNASPAERAALKQQKQAARSHKITERLERKAK